MPDGRLLRLEDVAQRLGVSYYKARLIVLDGGMPYLKVGARGIRVREDDFEAYIAKLEQKQEKEPDTREVYEGRRILGKAEEAQNGRE